MACGSALNMSLLRFRTAREFLDCCGRLASKESAACDRRLVWHNQRGPFALRWNSKHQDFGQMFADLPRFEIDDREHVFSNQHIRRVVCGLRDAALQSNFGTEVELELVSWNTAAFSGFDRTDYSDSNVDRLEG